MILPHLPFLHYLHRSLYGLLYCVYNVVWDIDIFLVSFCVKFYISWRSCVFNSLCVTLKFSPKVAFCCSICVNAYRRPLACLGSCWFLWMFVQGLYHAPSCNCFPLLPCFFKRKMSLLVRHIQCNNNKIQFYFKPTISISNFVKFFLITLLVLRDQIDIQLCVFVPWNQSLLFIFLLKCLILFLML